MSLFDGKTLKGWQGDVKGYAVENGTIVCKPGGQSLHRQAVRQFRLAVRVQAAAGRKQRRRHPHAPAAATPPTPAWKSRSSTTGIRTTKTSSPTSSTARSTASCRPNAASSSPSASGTGGNRGQRKPHQGHAQRHGDHRRRLEQDRQDDRPSRRIPACTTPRATSAGSATAIRWRSATCASRRCRKPRQLSARAAKRICLQIRRPQPARFQPHSRRLSRSFVSAETGLSPVCTAGPIPPAATSGFQCFAVLPLERNSAS